MPLFRAPHGLRSPLLPARGGRATASSAGRADLRHRPTGRRGDRRPLPESAPAGAILLLHDGDGSGQGGDRSQTVAALPHILASARERGLELVTVSQLAQELRPQRRTALKAAAFAVVIAALVLLVSQRFSLQVIANVFTDADPVFVLAALLANLGSVAAKALTWKAAIDAVPPTRTARRWTSASATSCRPIFIGFLLNTVLFARLGEVARVSVAPP